MKAFSVFMSKECFTFWSSHQREAEIGIKALQMEQKSKLKLDITSPSLPSIMEKGSFGLLHEAQAVGDDGKKTFGSGQIDKLKNGTMYNNSSTNVSIYRLAVTQKLCTTKAFFFKAKPRHFEVLDSPIRNSRFGAIKGASQQ